LAQDRAKAEGETDGEMNAADAVTRVTRAQDRAAANGGTDGEMNREEVTVLGCPDQEVRIPVKLVVSGAWLALKPSNLERSAPFFALLRVEGAFVLAHLRT
jgi:hypothetical protein